MVLAVPRAGTPRLYIDVGQTRTPIKDTQRERGTSLEHIMVGTEYGMAWEMTHGPAAGCVSRIAGPNRRRERNRCVYAVLAAETNKEAPIGAPNGGRSGDREKGREPG